MNKTLESMRGQATFVTIPFLPPFEEYTETLRSIWERQWLTNNGPLVQEFEQALARECGVDALRLVANGTLALQLLYRAFDLRGEVLTTPFTYVATSSSLRWEGCQPRFADIDPETFNLDPHAARAAITPQTRAIVATHVFGNPCEIEALASLAAEHEIPLLFDAAHAFGVTHRGHSLLSAGDASILSLHATKFFHSVEGGAVVARDKGILERVGAMRGFGHKGPEDFSELGINAKMSEFHAAMGLVNLQHTEELRNRRERQCSTYRRILSTSPKLRFQRLTSGTEPNHAYMPVLFPDASAVLRVIEALKPYNVHPRRYFYPSLDTLKALDLTGRGHCPASRDIASRILCLPLAHAYREEHIAAIAEGILSLLETPTVAP